MARNQISIGPGITDREPPGNRRSDDISESESPYKAVLLPDRDVRQTSNIVWNKALLL
jgi:hypothetical protein